MSDSVNHPAHYQSASGVEAIDVCEHLGFNLGNAYKYVARAGKKGPAAEDLLKAAWYLRRHAHNLAQLPYGRQKVDAKVARLLDRVIAVEDSSTPLWLVATSLLEGIAADHAEQLADKLRDMAEKTSARHAAEPEGHDVLPIEDSYWTLWGWYDPGEPCSMGFYTFHEAVDAMVARSKNPAEALVGPLVEWRGSMLVDQSTVSEALSEQASVDLSSPDLVEKVVKSVMAQAVAELDDKCDHVELEERVGEEATEEMRAILEDCATTVLLGYARDAVREWADKHILTHRPRVCSGDVVLPARYTRGAWRSPEAKGEAEATVDWSGGAWKATVGGVTVEAGSFLDAIEAAEKMMGAK